MGKATGFLEYTRKECAREAPLERVKSFAEFHMPMSEEERRKQGARCMNCGVPLCQSGMVLSGMVTGCPLHNLIPEWNDQVYQGHVPHALSRLLRTNPFPEFTGRVCPALCEKACVCGQNFEPVTIRDNELYVIEKAWELGEMKPCAPKIRSGKRVAVVGAGPAGLSCAHMLNRRGHEVTVFERDEEIGGLLMFGIPNQKLDKRVILRRREKMEAEGVHFVTGTDIGRDGFVLSVSREEKDCVNNNSEKQEPGTENTSRLSAAGKMDAGFEKTEKPPLTGQSSARDMLSFFDAVVLCCGAKQARQLRAENLEGAKGVWPAVDFLSSTTRVLDRELLPRGNFINAKDKDVVIIGGGDTGNDCVGTAIRHGCRSVVQIEMLPKPPAERQASNPWPEWPKVLKTDYGQEEAIALFGKDPRIYETTVKAVRTDKTGHITAVETVQVKFEGGKMAEVEGTEKKLKCQLLLVAAGFTGCEAYTPEAFGASLTGRGRIGTEGESHHVRDNLFAAGDMRRGQSLVVWAIAEGRTCAQEVDEYLMGYPGIS